jgi:hypothetical protein
MGRSPAQPGGVPRLSPKQREMLLLTIASGVANNFVPARFASAWVVRVGRRGAPSVALTFADSVGRRLLELGYIKLHPNPAQAVVRGPTGIIGRRYVPTQAGIRRLSGEQ